MAASWTLDLIRKAVAPVAIGAFAFFPPQAPAASETVNLSGRFPLNAAESEDARQKLHESMEGRRPGGPGMGGSHEGRPPGGGGGRPPAEGGHRGGPESLRDLLEAPKAMTLTHTPAEIAVLEEDGRLRTLHPDGKTYKAGGGTVEVKTRWDGARLVVESHSPQGPALTETWAFDAATGKLTIDMAVEAPGLGRVMVRRVYDREPQGAS